MGNQAGAEPLKIISWNLLHKGGATLAQVQQLVAAQKPDLLLLQEATAPMDALPHHLGGHYARFALPGRHHGLAAWSAAPFHAPSTSLALPRGLIVRRVCQIIDLGGFAVANVHLSHGQVLNRRQLRRIAAALPPRAAILGDCNMLGAALLPGFSDAGPRNPTHRSANLIPVRLDRCLLRGLTCTQAAVLGPAGSDHRPIMVVLD
jgi:endonuclease/exonuclease/phosphatase (EEP) superfamily protein YafD